MPWQVGLLMLVITAFAVVGFCILTGAEPDKGKEPAPIPGINNCAYWWEIPVALVILVVGLALIDLTTHGSTMGKIEPCIKWDPVTRTSYYER